MIKKIISIVVVILFSINNISFALNPAVTSNVLGDDNRPGTKGDMYALGQKLLANRKGLGPIAFKAYKPRTFIGKEPHVQGIDFVKADYSNLPKGWEKNPILQKTDLIEALKYFRDTEAQIPEDNLDIREGYFEVQTRDGALPIARLEEYEGRHYYDRRYALIVDTRFVQMWNHIRENDIWFNTDFEDERRTISLAWGIFYRLVKHEMSDLAKEDLFPKSFGHTTFFSDTDYLHVNKDEIVTNIIEGKYKLHNDIIWLWFLESYCLCNATRYNNDIFEKRLHWFFENEEAKRMKLHLEFPSLVKSNEGQKRWAYSLAGAINYHFFKDLKEVPESTVDRKFKDEYRERKRRIKEEPLYATGSDDPLKQLEQLVPDSFKAIAFDVDGTLTYEVDENPQDIIAKLIEILRLRKVHILLLTGRRYSTTRKFYKEITSSPYISEEDLKYLHIYIANAGVGFNALKGIEDSYYRKELDDATFNGIVDFFMQNGWLDSPDLNMYLPEEDRFKVSVKNKDGEWGGKLLEILEETLEYVQEKGLPVEVKYSGAAVDITPADVNKGLAIEDAKKRFGLSDEEIIKVGDKGHRDGNDFELLRYVNSFTVADADTSNPDQVDVAEILGKKGPEATSYLLDVFIKKLTEAVKDRERTEPIKKYSVTRLSFGDDGSATLGLIDERGARKDVRYDTLDALGEDIKSQKVLKALEEFEYKINEDIKPGSFLRMPLTIIKSQYGGWDISDDILIESLESLGFQIKGSRNRQRLWARVSDGPGLTGIVSRKDEPLSGGLTDWQLRKAVREMDVKWLVNYLEKNDLDQVEIIRKELAKDPSLAAKLEEFERLLNVSGLVIDLETLDKNAEAINVFDTVKTRELSLPEQIIEERDLIYENLAKSKDTSDQAKFNAISQLAEYIYGEYGANNPEIDDYTRESDRYHYKEVLELVLDNDPQADICLKIAALLHDIGRFMPKLRVKYLSDGKLDIQIRKKVIHPLNCARITDRLVEGLGLSDQEREKIRFLIEHHDGGVDEISLAGRILLSQVPEDHPYYKDLRTLTEADSASFFKTTIKLFVQERFDKKHESREKLLMRISMLYNRLKNAEMRARVDEIMETKWKPQDKEIYDIFIQAKQAEPSTQPSSAVSSAKIKEPEAPVQDDFKAAVFDDVDKTLVDKFMDSVAEELRRLAREAPAKTVEYLSKTDLFSQSQIDVMRDALKDDPVQQHANMLIDYIAKTGFWIPAGVITDEWKDDPVKLRAFDYSFFHLTPEAHQLDDWRLARSYYDAAWQKEKAGDRASAVAIMKEAGNTVQKSEGLYYYYGEDANLESKVDAFIDIGRSLVQMEDKEGARKAFRQAKITAREIEDKGERKKALRKIDRLQKKIETTDASDETPPMGGGLDVGKLRQLAQRATAEELVDYVVEGGHFNQVGVIREALGENPTKLEGFEQLLYAEEIKKFEKRVNEEIKPGSYIRMNTGTILSRYGGKLPTEIVISLLKKMGFAHDDENKWFRLKEGQTIREPSMWELVGGALSIGKEVRGKVKKVHDEAYRQFRKEGLSPDAAEAEAWGVTTAGNRMREYGDQWGKKPLTSEEVKKMYEEGDSKEIIRRIKESGEYQYRDPIRDKGPRGGGLDAGDLQRFAKEATAEELVNYIVEDSVFKINQVDVIREALKEDSVKLQEFEQLLAQVPHSAAVGWSPIPELDNKILVNRKAGTIRFSDEDAVLDVEFDLWVARHGETKGNALKILQGKADIPIINQLNETGQEQAKKAAESLFENLEEKIRSGEDIIVLTSTLMRSKETAEVFIDLVKERTGITLATVAEEDADEISFGVCGNTPYEIPSDEVKRELKKYGIDTEVMSNENDEIRMRWMDGDAAIKFEEGESFIDVLVRSKRLLEKLSKEYKGKTIVLIGHGTQITATRILLRKDLIYHEKEGWIKWRPEKGKPSMELGNAECKQLADGAQWLPVDGLDEKVLVNKETGQIKFAEGAEPILVPEFELWSLRHGASFGNEQGILQGAVNEPINHLSETGQQQAVVGAEELFEQLGEEKIRSGEIIYVASGLVRSQETADAFVKFVKERFGMDIEYLKDSLANEMSFGKWANNPRKTFLEGEDKAKIEWHRKWMDEYDAQVRPPARIGGESFIDVIMRNRKLLEGFNEKYKGKTVVVFDHGTCITAKRVLLGDSSLVNEEGIIDWQSTNFANVESRNLTNPTGIVFSEEKAGLLLDELFKDTSTWTERDWTPSMLLEKMYKIAGSREVERKAVSALFESMQTGHEKLADLIADEEFRLLLPDPAKRFDYIRLSLAKDDEAKQPKFEEDIIKLFMETPSENDMFLFRVNEAILKRVDELAQRKQYDDAKKTAKYIMTEFDRSKGIYRVALQQLTDDKDAAIQTALEVEDDLFRAHALRDIAKSLAEDGMFEEAEAVARIIEMVDHQLDIRSLTFRYIVEAYTRAGPQYIAKAQILSESIEDPEEQAIAFSRVGKAFMSFGQKESAKSSFEKAISIAQKIENEFGKEEALKQISEDKTESGLYDRGDRVQGIDKKDEGEKSADDSLEQHPLITVISEYIAQTWKKEGPGAVEEKEEPLSLKETQSVYETVQLVHTSRIEILQPQHFGLTDDMKKALKDIGKDTVSCKGYSDAMHLKQLLRQPIPPGVKRIIITDIDNRLVKRIRSCALGYPELFKDVRLLSIELPDSYTDMPADQKTIHQARTITLAIFARLLEKDETPMVEAVLRDMLKGHIDADDVDDFIERLGESDADSIEKIWERILFFLDKPVSLIQTLAKEIQYLKLFWHSL